MFARKAKTNYKQPTEAEKNKLGPRKNEITEIMEQLNNNNLDIKRAAIRRIISAMTLGKDVSMLFPAIVKNMETQNMELKKLIYLYIINYAKQHSELAILATNTFRKDAVDKKNPFMRGLAVRTMGCLRVKEIIEYLIQPLKEALNDEDPYIRKTGVLCVAKLYDSHPELIEELELIKVVNAMLGDDNSMVMSNAIMCLQNINSKGGPKMQLDFRLISKMLLALNEANEWSQSIILDAISNYEAQQPSEAERVLERVAVQTTHRNSGVVLSAVRVMVKMLDYLDDLDMIRNYSRRVTPSLITLLSAENEIKFVALKNIAVIVEKRPLIVEQELNNFFCNFSDPIYVKTQKLEIIVKLANEDNIDQILHELKEYVLEVDIDFVRKCIKAIGKLAIKIEPASDKCVQALWDCLKQKSNLVLQESIIVIKDIFRRYPQKYEGLLPELCAEIKTIDEPESRAALVWILGEYVEDIENADEIIGNFFLESFREEAPQVQTQILTTCVRLCLVSPKEGKPLLMKVFKVMEDCENVDLRKRGYFYWRLLSYNPELAKKIVCGEKPVISEQGLAIEPVLLDKLIDNLNSVACVYKKAPETFVRVKVDKDRFIEDEPLEEDYDDGYQQENYVDSTGQKMGENEAAINANANYLDDIMGLEAGAPEKKHEKPQEVNKNITIPFNEVLNEGTPGVENQRNGVKVTATTQLEHQDQMVLYLKITNTTNETLDELYSKFNANSYCLNPKDQELDISTIPPRSTVETRIVIDMSGPPNNQPPETPMKIQIALHTSIDIFVFFVPVSFSVLLRYPSEYSEAKFKELMAKPNHIKTQNSIDSDLVSRYIEDPTPLIEKFSNNNFQYVTKQEAKSQLLLSFVTQTVDGFDLVLQVLLQPNGKSLLLNYMVPHPALVKLFFQAIKFIVDF